MLAMVKRKAMAMGMIVYSTSHGDLSLNRETK